MKKLFFTLCFSSLILLSSQAQDTIRRKELGVIYNNLNGLGLTFKIGSNKAVWRINTQFSFDKNTSQTEDTTRNYKAAFYLGREGRVSIKGKIEIRLGADCYINYQNEYQRKPLYKVSYGVNTPPIYSYNGSYASLSTKKIDYGINLVIGLNFVISDRFVIGAEWLPSIGKNITKTEQITYVDYTSFKTYQLNEDQVSGTSYRLFGNSSLLSISYKF